jgi:hypothetical protein
VRALYFILAFVVMASLAALLARNVFGPTDLANGQSSNPGEFQSGPQVGAKIPGPFEPLNINGKDAGKEACLYCRYENEPVLMVFASKPGEGVKTLVREFDKAVLEAKKPKEVGACVIVTQMNKDTENSLLELSKHENLQNVVLAMIEPKQVRKYTLHPDAQVTVLMYDQRVVKVNHAFKSNELTEARAKELGAEAKQFLLSH